MQAVATNFAEQVNVAHAKPTAVVVDDSATSRRSLANMLSQAGFDVVAEGDSGDKAISLYECYSPSLLTLDIVLPVMDGVTVARLLMARFPSAAVVMCSSINARDKILACRSAGVSHFILKPFDQQKINEVIQAVLARQGLEQMNRAAV